jgi:phosphoenolpyruvate synthase/pyruvate phosphate dikinase
MGNPILGFRGASRYYHERYQAAFELECVAMKKVRETMGFSNVKLLIPFIRTVKEGKTVLQVMAGQGLKWSNCYEQHALPKCRKYHRGFAQRTYASLLILVLLLW